MENYTETGKTYEKSASGIISNAFEIYKGAFLYAILMMVVYLVLSFLIQPISGFDSDLLADEIKSANGDFSVIDFSNIPGLGFYYGLSGLFGLLISPLFVGLIYIANKVNNKVAINISDLFIGYKQNFLNIVLYTLITNIIMTIGLVLCVLPALFIMPLFFIGYPILLFENANAIDAIKKSFQIASANYGTFLGAALLSLLVSLSGLLLCGVGVIATVPFLLVAMYAAYVAFLGTPRQIIYNS